MIQRILHLIPSLDPKAGGMSQAVRSMIGYSGSMEYIHEVLCLDVPNADHLQEEFMVYALGNGKSAWNYHASLKSWLRKYAAQYNHILVHGLWQYQSHAITQVISMSGNQHINLYVMPHGMLDPYFQKAAGRRFKAIRNIICWHLVEKKLVESAASLLFTCEQERLLAKISFQPYRPKKELVIGLGVEKPPAYRHEMMEDFYTACPEVMGYNYFLFLGRLDPKKGTDLLIRAYLKLKASRPHLPKLVIAGPGLETDFGQQLVRIAARNEDIRFTGMLTGMTKWGAFYGCEAFILPSHQENFGIAVVEAMACAKPVLISDQVNICKEIIAAKAGFVEEDTEEGVRALLQCWSARSLAEQEQIGLNARAGYEKYFAEYSAGSLLRDLFRKECYD